MEWVNCFKQIPNERVFVLVYCPKGNLGNAFIGCAYRIKDNWFDYNDHSRFDTPMPVTHWMPLPEPPKEN